MKDASPAFQNDGAFQFAADFGYQTQTPVWAGELAAGVLLDSPTRYAPHVPSRAYTGELVAAVSLESPTAGKRATGYDGSGVWEIPRPRHYAYTGELVAVVDLDAPTRRTRRPRPVPPRRYAVVGVIAIAGTGGAWASPARALDYVADVLVPDDEDALLALLGGRE